MGTQKNRFIETVLLSTHNRFNETVLLSTHNICFGWEIKNSVLERTLMVLSHINGAVTYKRIKVTDAERTEKRQKNWLSGDGSRLGGDEGHLGSRKERIRTGQVTDKERSTHVCVTEV